MKLKGKQLLITVHLLGLVGAVTGCGRTVDRVQAAGAPIATVETLEGGTTIPTAKVSTSAASSGSVPDSAWNPDGSPDLSKMPTFISTFGRDGVTIVGFIRATDLFGATSDAPKTVYGKDLVTVVGHVYPGVGFVALSEKVESIPTIPVRTANTPPPSSAV
jgi:hypothetical protein